MCFNIGAVAKDLTSTPSFGKMWDSFGEVDPLIHGAIDDQSKFDDRVTGSVLGEVGLSGPAKYFNSSAEDPTKSAEHHAVLGLAWLGGEAALGGGGVGGAEGGGDALGQGAVDAGSEAGGGSGASTSGFGGVGSDPAVSGPGAGGGASTSGGSSWMDYAKTTAKALAPVVVSSLLAPKAPKAAAPIAMPDPLAQQQAQQEKLLQQLARRGRASTILTSPASGGGSLGG